MTDFVTQLEAELLAAAHRRAANRRRRLPRLSPRPILAVASLAAALAAVVLLVARPAPAPGPPAARQAAAFTIPVADRAAPCDARTPEVTQEPAPKTVFDAIGLLRTNGAGERLQPTLRGEWFRPFGTWLPAGAIVPRSERQPQDTSKLYVLPTADVRSGPIACGPTEPRGPGACLIYGGVSGDPAFTRCFTLDEVKAGRAFTLVDVSSEGARMVGLVPDGAAQVDFANGGAHALLPVRENVVVQYVQGLTAADQVTTRLETRKPLVLVINETDIPGLATTTADAVRKLGIAARADAARPTARRQTVVGVARPGAEPLADRVAKLLGAHVEPVEKPSVDADVVVLLGSDRMR